MKAMVLAAGRGVRMRPLTEHMPKALIKVNGTPLIVHHLLRLRAAGITEIVINLGYLGEMIRDELGDGSAYGVNIVYSDEASDVLETGGGIIKALPLLGDTLFFAVNADVYTDYKIQPLALKAPTQAHLVMVNNPKHNLAGDFGLSGGYLVHQSFTKLTFSGMGYYTVDLFAQFARRRLPLIEILYSAIGQGLVSAEHYRGKWVDVGTMERLNIAQAMSL